MQKQYLHPIRHDEIYSPEELKTLTEALAALPHYLPPEFVLGVLMNWPSDLLDKIPNLPRSKK